MIQVGTPKEIYEPPATAEVAAFVGRCNFLEASVAEVSSSGAAVTLAANGESLRVETDHTAQWDKRSRSPSDPRSCVRAHPTPGSAGRQQPQHGGAHQSYLGSRYEYDLKLGNQVVQVVSDRAGSPDRAAQLRAGACLLYPEADVLSDEAQHCSPSTPDHEKDDPVTTTDSHTYPLGVLHGDGIGPEIVPAAVLIADAAVEAAGVAPIRLARAPAGLQGHRGAQRSDARQHAQGARRRRTAGCSDRTTARHTPSRSARSSTPAAPSASTSICTRTSAPPRRSRAATPSSMAPTWSSCGRTPKASTPTATPSAAPASSCRLPTSRSCTGHHHPAGTRTDRPLGVRAGVAAPQAR